MHLHLSAPLPPPSVLGVVKPDGGATSRRTSMIFIRSACLNSRKSMPPEPSCGAEQINQVIQRTTHPKDEGWHFSCERGCTRDDHGKAGPFSVERLEMDLAFANVLYVQTCAQRSAGPLGLGVV